MPAQHTDQTMKLELRHILASRTQSEKKLVRASREAGDGYTEILEPVWAALAGCQPREGPVEPSIWTLSCVCSYTFHLKAMAYHGSAGKMW